MIQGKSRGQLLMETHKLRELLELSRSENRRLREVEEEHKRILRVMADRQALAHKEIHRLTRVIHDPNKWSYCFSR